MSGALLLLVISFLVASATLESARLRAIGEETRVWEE
jgi:hypothetical protein